MGKQIHSDGFKRAGIEQGAVVSTTDVGFRSADDRGSRESQRCPPRGA